MWPDPLLSTEGTPPATAVPVAEAEPSTVWDLPVYLLGGFGLFVVASVVVGAWLAPTGEVSLTVALAAYALNCLCLGGMTWVLGVWRGRFTWAEIGFWPARWQAWYLAAAVGLMVAFTPLRALLALAAQVLLEGGMESLQSRSALLGTGMDSAAGFVLTLLFAGLLVPISEELYFRGLLLRWFQPRLGRWSRIVLTATLFGLAHFDSVGVVVSTFLLGLFCAYAYERTRSIWFAIAIHAVNNSVAVLLLYFAAWLTDNFAR